VKKPWIKDSILATPSGKVPYVAAPSVIAKDSPAARGPFCHASMHFCVFASV
jgi:hypothetical protein